MTSIPPSRGPRWDRALREHRDALSALNATLEKVDAADWQRPLFSGKWSPAQIAQHLALVYENLSRELAGGGRMQDRARPWQQRIFRWVLLPHILFHNSIPLRASSPRELRPSPAGLPYLSARDRLAKLADGFEARLLMASAKDASFNHPYFGRLSALQTLRFCSAHMEHHRRQIAKALTR